ncbi:MAG: TolC family outer membrane protein [Rhodospirillales bacterium]
MNSSKKWRARRAGSAAVLLACAAVFTPIAAPAQTLEEALSQAYANNPEILRERAIVRAADEGVPQALANWRPRVQAAGDYGVAETSTNPGFTQTQPASVGLTVTQPLFRGGRTVAETAEAENKVQAARARLISIEQNVLLQAATAYFNVVRAEATLDLSVNNERVLRRQLEATEDRFEVGEITRTDVHQAKARLARSTASRIQGEGDLENARAVYQKVVGAAPPGGLEFPGPPAGLPESESDAQRGAAAGNPDIIAAEFNHKAALDAVDAGKGALLPELSFTGGASRTLEAVRDAQQTDKLSASVRLTMPLYQQGAVYSRVRQAKQFAAQQLSAVDVSRRAAVEAATRAWETLVSARAQVASFQTQVEAAEVALEGVEGEAGVGARTVLDVLDAEQELLDARVSAVTARRDELTAAYQLKAALGQMTAAHLQLPVTLYDPGAHYNAVRDQWFGTSGPGADGG